MIRTVEEVLQTLVAYKATNIEQHDNKITAVLGVEDIPNDDAEDEDDLFSPFLSLCSYIACTDIKMRIADWIFKPQNSYKVELEV